MKPLLRQITAPILALIITIYISVPISAQGIHTFSGSETAVFSELALNSNASAVWSTDRSSTPGYFSAVSDAFYSGAANGTNSLVDGYVKYYRGTTATATQFIFPSGQGTDYKPVTIAGTIPNNSIFSTAWFASDPGVTTDPTDGVTHSRTSRGSGVISVLQQGFWDWETIAGTASSMTITVTIPDLSASSVTANLILVGWDGTKWINLSGVAGAGPYSNNWANGNTEGSSLTGTWQAGITALGMGSLSFILPLKLESFNGKANACNADLTWKTADEQNTSHFIVQSSADGSSWVNLATITAQGYGAGKEYNYTASQNSKNVKYRLLMADRDNKQTFSPVVSVITTCGQEENLKVFPNPVTTGSGVLKISMTTNYSGKANLVINNGIGQTILNRSIALTEGTNTADINTGSFAIGTYVLSVTDEKGQRLFKPQTIVKK